MFDRTPERLVVDEQGLEVANLFCGCLPSIKPWHVDFVVLARRVRITLARHVRLVHALMHCLVHAFRGDTVQSGENGEG